MEGVLIVDKPEGWTSHDVVARVRRLCRERRVGHTGTLDPFATGVLVVLVGRATRLAQFLAGAEKEYEASVRFGYATNTGDSTGAPREERAGGASGAEASATPGTSVCDALDEARIEAALATLRGEIEQVPPMYSAKKVEGKKLYELARQGVEVERKPVRVFVREFEAVREGELPLLSRNNGGTCDLRVRVVCSAGTYVRALAESLGGRLGVGAHLAALRRTRAGAFGLEQARTLEHLGGLAEVGALAQALLPLDAALPGMPAAHLTDEQARRVAHGAAVRVEPRDAAGPRKEGVRHVRLHDGGGALLAVAEYDPESGLARPRVTLAGAENKR